MIDQNANRRDFLRGSFGGISAGAATASFLPKRAGAKQARAKKKVIYRPGEKPSPGAIFSPGIQLGNLVFVSSQDARDPKTGSFPDGPFPNQVRQCLENLKTVLEAAGSPLDQVLKCTVFLTDIADYQAMNEVYHTYFPTDPPSEIVPGLVESGGSRLSARYATV